MHVNSIVGETWLRRLTRQLCTAAVSVGAIMTSPTLATQQAVLVRDGKDAVPIVIEAKAPPSTVQAAEELADYIAKISGVRPTIRKGELEAIPATAIWVGPHPQLSQAVPSLTLNFAKPEETLMFSDGRHVVITGRDKMTGTKQIEHGTANAVFNFLEDKLEVRWLWPGPLGEDVIKKSTIAFGPFEQRFAPPFRYRKLWPSTPPDWHLRQRLTLDSLAYRGGHAFEEWWSWFGETNPEFFAMQPDGKRGPWVQQPKYTKICYSNPEVWKTWLNIAEKRFKEDPTLVCLSASPNDGPAECLCPACKSWDPPQGPEVTVYSRNGVVKTPSLTDRHVKFWNILAKGLRERFPDRELFIGAYAYATYKPAPVVETVDPMVVIGYVGHAPLSSDVNTQKERDEWLGWAAKTTGGMVYRPNLFHYSGGWLGIPSVSTRRTIDTFRWLAQNKCIGIEIDTLPRNWSTQGLQFYLLAQLTYDPLQDPQALLKDYYRRAFGPGADDIEQYFATLEVAHDAMLQRVAPSSGQARQMIDIIGEEFKPEIMERAETALKAAEAKVAGEKNVHTQRVAFVRAGLDFTKLQLEMMSVMKRARDSKGTDRAAVERALQLQARRESMYKAFDGRALQDGIWFTNSRGVHDWIGPVSDAFKSAAYPGSEPIPDFRALD